MSLILQKNNWCVAVCVLLEC